MVSYNRENNPNAGLFIAALRNLGYNNISAINDIIDNALDAEADKVIVKIEKVNGVFVISIIDNGYGMDFDILDQALRLGSAVERDITAELGKFGMGLSTASISIAQVLEVLTKQPQSDEILKSAQDVNEIIKANSFIKYLGEPSKQDLEFFNQYLGEKGQGTIVRMIDCDRLTNKNVNNFAARLTKEIGRTFREYINAGREFYVNGKKVEAEDIYMLSEGGEIYSDEEYEFTFKDEDGTEKKETIRVRLGILPDFGPAGSSERKINAATQGFYVMRNNREIEKGSTLGFYTRHPQLNRFRGEIFFSATLDDNMGVNFQKNGVDLDQAIFDKIHTDVKHQIIAINRMLQKGKAAKGAQDIDHKESERHINKKAPLLRTPKPSDDVGKQINKQKNEEGGRGKDKNPRKPREDVRVRFEAQHDGKAGHIYEARMEGKTTVIVWNIDHPFYERFVVGTKDDKALSTSIDFMIYSLATAELNIMNDETLDMIEEFKNVMSLNLNTLLR
ncbi:ATP-binding protein [Priestia megaterium]|uniref:ATP-binding protein n=1 Tax=Priestia megaterium TaxID=1404 RepID=UPI002E211C42|nr:ATP-binding protein [Priestia megaterium]